MNKTTIGMGLVLLIMAVAAYFRGGLSMVGGAFIIGAKTLVSVSPILILAFLLAGFVNVLIAKDTVTKWLGREAGWKGPFYGSLLGAMVPRSFLFLPPYGYADSSGGQCWYHAKGTLSSL